MKKIFIPFIIVIALIIAGCSQAISTNQIIENKLHTISINIIFIDKNNTDGPWDGTSEYPYQHIQDAIDNATESDIIQILEGTYYEQITIDKPITIAGTEKNNTIIDGTHQDTIINITSNNVILTNLTIKNSGGYKDNAGIEINSENTTISNCIIYRTKTGISGKKISNSEITNCILHTNGEGIFLQNSYDCKIKNVQICHNSIGIDLQESHYINITDSYVHTNGIGILSYDSSNIEITHCAVCDNNDNQGGIFLIRCSQVNIKNCNVNHNGVCIKIDNSSLIQLTNCNFYWGTHFTIGIKENSRNVVISNCAISESFRYGIHSKNSKFTAKNNNIFKNHLFGLYAESSTCNVRYNWWGFPTGPALFQFGLADRMSRKLDSKSLYLPWKTTKINNIGADWDEKDIFTQFEIPADVHHRIKFIEEDTDNDGCPNWWEAKWGYNPTVWNDHEKLDPDEDGLNNIEECFTDQWNSNPFHKDAFIEFDWIESKNPGVTNRPPSDELELMKHAFEKHNITLHIDDGLLGDGEKIPFMTRFSFSDLRDIYWDYFLHNDINNPRKGIFRYCLVCDYGPSSGFAFMGWDQLDSFCISAQSLIDGSPQFTRGRLIVTGAMHETGHTFGLLSDDFEGNDNRGTIKPYYIDFWKYINYKSCMSYQRTWTTMDYSDGTHGPNDFDDWGNLDFTFFKDTHFEWPKETA